MTKEEFVYMINLAEKFSKEVDRWCDFGINVLESSIGNIPWEIFNVWVNANFNSDDCDWINWYLFERKSIITNEILPCWDEEGNKIYIENSEQLYKFLYESEN